MISNGYDIVIIGGGPAGSTLARLLHSNYKVVLIDKKSKSDDSFQKPCGGLLAPDAQKAIAKSGLCLPADIVENPQLFAVKTTDIAKNITRYYQRFYLNINRHKFDMWLLSLAEKNDNTDIIYDALCIHINETKNGFEVKYKKDGKEQILRSRYIVGADGANSIVRKLFFKQKIRKYTAIQEWYKINTENAYYAAFFDSTITDCYAWMNYKSGCQVIGAALDPKQPAAKFELLKKKLEKYGYGFDKPIKTEACTVFRPLPNQTICGRGNIFLIGEAGGFISPSSLEGISYAMETADALYRSFHTDTDIIKNYKKNTFKLRIKLFLKQFKIPFMYWSVLRNIIMKSNIMSVNKSKPDNFDIF